MNVVYRDLLKERKTEVINHVIDEIVVDHVANVKEVEENLIKHVGVKDKDEDAGNLGEGILLKGYHIVVNVFRIQVVDGVMNIELPVHNVHESVDLRVDDDIIKVVTVDPNVVVTLDVNLTVDGDNQTADDDNLDDVVNVEVVSEVEVYDDAGDAFDDDLLDELVLFGAIVRVDVVDDGMVMFIWVMYTKSTLAMMRLMMIVLLSLT